MKKAKIMLMTIAVFAVVGGALAFKAKKFNGIKYCTTTSQGQFCSLTNDNLKITNVAPSFSYKYTTTDAALNCPTNIQNCLGSTFFTTEQ